MTHYATPRDDDTFGYFRDHDISGAWGVRNWRSGRVVAVGLDKTDALMIGLFLSGRVEDAERLRVEVSPHWSESAEAT